MPNDFKEHPVTLTSIKEPYNPPLPEDESDDDGPALNAHGNVNGSEKRKRRAKRRAHELEDEAEGIWEYVKELVLRPGVAGGILGVGA